MNATVAQSRLRPALATLVVILAVTLSACQTTPDQEPTRDAAAGSQQPEIQAPGAAAAALDAEGNYAGAAQAWLSLAKSASQPTVRGSYLARAAASYLQAGNLPGAEQVLNSMQQRNTPGWLLNMARLRLLQGQPARTLELLVSLPVERLDRPALKQHLSLQAMAYTRLGNHLEAARQRVALDTLLEDALSRDANHTELWSSLNNLSSAALSSVYAVTTPGHFRDWIELAILNQQARQVGGHLQLENWQQRHPLHPATPRFLDTLRSIGTTATTRPQQVALLLPLGGRIAEPARAVRDGFLAAYYRDRPDTTLRLYDTSSGDVGLVYKRAVADGADFVVGPLAKDALKSLAQQAELEVPTLALNAIDGPANEHSKLYQFGLLPEDEARQVAEHAWQDGHSKGIILYPESGWGQRIAGAFQAHWQTLGGQLVDMQAYSLASRDLGRPIRDLLKITDSQQRFNKLKAILGGKLEFETRRRQDIDFIFLAAFPEQARQIRPQLKFYKAARVPVYATSHVFTGKVDKQRDRDMNGITFGDMPWNLEDRDQGLHTTVDALWQNRSEKLPRFYALGIDAYNLIPHIKRLQQYPFERFDGQTGTLRMNTALQLQRQLSWAQFRGGQPRAVSQNLDLQRFRPPADNIPATPDPATPPGVSPGPVPTATPG